MSEFMPNPLFIEEIRRGPVLQAEMQHVAEEGEAIAKRLVRVDTGELQDSIHVEDAPDGGKRVVAGTDHWSENEFGTSDMPAQPFLRPILTELDLHR